jgi:hypothetical protein
MWVIYFFISYFVLALLVPTVWVLWRTWSRARTERQVNCPHFGAPALVKLDPWYAVRMHALGDREVLVKDCARWPERRGCGQECLKGIGTAT